MIGDVLRFQRPGVCELCDGQIHFYPAPVTDEQALAEGTDPSGEWVHRQPADWINNPHDPVPVEG